MWRRRLPLVSPRLHVDLPLMTYPTTALDDLIDQFESEWSPGPTSSIRTTLEQFGLTNDEVAITELVRIDIERRYCSGLSCRLDDYFSQFPVLLVHPERAVEIAYEDYRVCTQLGHPIPPERYRSIPGIESQTWHQHFQLEFLQEEFNAPRSPADQQKTNQESSTHVDEPIRIMLKKIGFEPIQRLGSGAFSQVYLAQQDDLARRYVVLKVVRQPRGEPQMMAMLQHTNIVPIYSFHYVDSFSVICMPYAGGVTLNDYLHNAAHGESRDGESLIRTICNRNEKTIEVTEEFDFADRTNPNKLPNPLLTNLGTTPLQPLRVFNNEQLAVWIFERLAGALSHSHARGVLHGDIKPANVLIRNDGEPALMDFNLSRSLQHANGETVGGTLAYMSPENMRRMMQGTSAEDQRSDIYSLGMMLFELLTGELPFPQPFSQADTDIEAAIAARQEPLRWSAKHRISNSLQSILKRCLAFHPDERYESASQLHEDLQRESQNRPLRFARESISSQLTKWVQRHPRSTSAASVSMLSLVCLVPLVWLAVGWRSSSIQANATVSFETFADESNDTLLSMMANPQRYEAAEVKALLLPLENSRLLEKKTIDELILPNYLDAAAIEHRRSVLLRHTVSAALAECERLHQNQEVDQSHNTLAKLVEAAKYLAEQDTSRAVTHLEARFAAITGKHDLASSLLQQAEKLAMQSDSEYYLEAVRLMADRKWSSARDMLGTLADRNAIPTTLRWTSLGRTQLQLGQYEDAKLSFTQSLERAPNASRLWLLRASCWGKLGDLNRAENDLKQALALDPTMAMGT
jgi:eukaryotic-like serine/threonine-protein kinase